MKKPYIKPSVTTRSAKAKGFLRLKLLDWRI